MVDCTETLENKGESSAVERKRTGLGVGGFCTSLAGAGEIEAERFDRPKHCEQLEAECLGALQMGRVYGLDIDERRPEELVEAAHTLTRIVPFDIDMYYDREERCLFVRKHEGVAAEAPNSSDLMPYWDKACPPVRCPDLGAALADLAHYGVIDISQAAIYLHCQVGNETLQNQAGAALAPVLARAWHMEDWRQRKRDEKEHQAKADD